ncbi:uncharacterized protein A4U43_C01F11980 [Asparagus officinalis]|uniref:BRO1 domain-containing protein n=1 Tax=Asparagus officinalis TaxID=4686 RepID=A0A5P1FQD3_ASPOF|nr:uncharacterized protein A4U43_C01F11980 [Asparagus officinalis]
MLAVHEKKTTATDIYRPSETTSPSTTPSGDPNPPKTNLERSAISDLSSRPPPPATADLCCDQLHSYFKALTLIEPWFHRSLVPLLHVVCLYYEEAYAALNSAPLNQHFDRTWISHVQSKSAQFYAESCYRYALELLSKDEIAEEIARLKIGLGALSDAKKSSKGVAAPLLDSVSKPESDMNPSLGKPVPRAEVLDASKERMFSGNVPDTSAKALSRYTEMVDDIIRTQAEKLQQGSEIRYTEMVDDIIRTQAEKLQQGSEITRVKLKEMDLPDSILALEGNITLPMDLKEDVEIESALPSLARPIMSLDSHEDAIVGALKQSLVKYSFIELNAAFH